MISLGSLACVAIAVAVLSLDQVHLLQLNVSRPLVVGPVVGALVGDLRLGLWIGAWIELVWITIIPVGHYAQPETVAATAIAVLCGRLLHPGAPATLADGVVGIAFGIPWGLLARRFDFLQRRRVAAWSETWILRLADVESPPSLARLFVGSVLFKTIWVLLLLASAFAAASLVVGAGNSLLAPRTVLSARLTPGLELAASWLPLLGAASLARVLDLEKHPAVFALGAIAGALWGALT